MASAIPPEALKEVTILSVVPPAEYGDGATQILSVLKDGSNKYHGSAGVWLQNWESTTYSAPAWP